MIRSEAAPARNPTNGGNHSSIPIRPARRIAGASSDQKLAAIIIRKSPKLSDMT